MKKQSSPSLYFYVRTDDGITEMPVIEKWECSGRVLVLHEGEKGEYAISDYLTGMRFCSHKYKAKAKRLAEDDLAKAANKIAAGTFTWSTYPEINSNDFISGWNAANDLFRSRGNYLEGVLMAFKLHQKKTA